MTTEQKKKLISDVILAYSTTIKDSEKNTEFHEENPTRLGMATGTMMGFSKGLELWNSQQIKDELDLIKDVVLEGKDLYTVGFGIGLMMTLDVLHGGTKIENDLLNLINTTQKLK